MGERMRTIVVAVAVLLGACCASLWGQASQVSQIAGIVQDASGAVVPGAQISITNTDTGISHTVESGPDGAYIVPDLPPGPYRLDVSKAGFAAYTQTGIVLQVNTNPHINVALKVGTANEKVEVQADAAMVETQSTGIGQVIDQTRVLDLPLNGRQITDLIALSGGATNLSNVLGAGGTTAGASLNIVTNKNYPTSVAVSVAGGQGTQTLYLLDGGSNMDLVSGIGLPMPFPDALQEFRIETSSLPANYGTQPGGVVNVITKSGGNEIHGSAFEFLRNYALNARNFFAATRDSLKRNQFGGTVGGPIRKNRLFFFAGYQGTYEKIAPAANIDYVATAAELRGDFTGLESPACNAGVQRTLPAPFVNNQVSPTLLNPVALNLLKLIPTSTDPCGKLTFGIPGSDHENQIVTKVDWQISSKQSVFGRYFVTDYEHPPIYNGDNLLTMSTDASVGLSDRVQTAVLGHNYAFGPSTISTFRLGFSRSAITRYTPPGVPTWTDLGSNVTPGIPGYFALTVANFFTPVCTNCSPGPWKATTYQASEGIVLIRGRHQVSVGVNVMNLRLNAAGNYQKNGQFIVTGQITGNAMADLLLGLPVQYGQSNGQLADERYTVPSLYAQDSIRLGSRFTVNAGLRWDPFTSPAAAIPQVSIFDLGWYNAGTQSTRFTNAPAGVLYSGDPGMPGGNHYYQSRMAEFSPRLGVVYDPRGQGKETVRAGYGIFYGTMPLFMVGGYHAPFTSAITIPAPAGGLSNPWQGWPGGNPFPTPASMPSNYQFPAFGATGLGAFKRDLKPAYMEQWNLALQKQFPGDWLISATYMGNRSLHLSFGEPYNPVVFIPGTCSAGQYGLSAAGPCSTAGNENYRRALYLANPTKAKYFGNIANFGDGAKATYNGLLLSAQHRFTHGFTILANHTWSHCLTETDIGLNGGNASQDPYNRDAEYGNCLVDRRNAFNVTMIVQTPKFSSKMAQQILGDWQESTIFSAATGSYSTVVDGVDDSLSGILNPGNVSLDRPNQIASASVSNPTIAKWFNTAAFAMAPTGSRGSLGRSTILGPGSWNADIALFRTFRVTEHARFDFRWEAFNILNHTRLAGPNTTLSSPSFGQIQAAAPPRIMQFALKFSF